MTITIPYGNFGSSSRIYDVLDQYREHFLFLDGSTYKVCNKAGLILLRNRLNEHLPEITLETWRDWVDWVRSLDPGTNNLLDVPVDFSGNAPSGTISSLEKYGL